MPHNPVRGRLQEKTRGTCSMSKGTTLGGIPERGGWQRPQKAVGKAGHWGTLFTDLSKCRHRTRPRGQVCPAEPDAGGPAVSLLKCDQRSFSTTEKCTGNKDSLRVGRGRHSHSPTIRPTCFALLSVRRFTKNNTIYELFYRPLQTKLKSL